MLKKMSKKQKIVTGSVGVILLLLIAGTLKVVSGNVAEQSRKNSIELVNHYADIGQYDRALDLLEKILLKNANDKDALSLMDKISTEKKNNLAKDKNNSDSPVQVKIDTKGISNAMQTGLDSVSSELAKTNAAAAKNQEAIKKLLDQQQKQAEEEAAKQSEQKAAKERARVEDEKRKVAEEELAKKNKEVKEAIDTINKDIELGKSNIGIGHINEALAAFSDAAEKLPVSAGEPDFSASKYTQMASLMYTAAEDNKTPDYTNKLTDTAVKYAKKSVTLKDNQAGAHYVLGMDAAAKKDRKTAIAEITKAIKLDNSNSMYYYQLGKLQYRQKDFSSARSSFESAAKINPKFEQAQYNLGVTLQRLGLWQKAIDSFRTAHTINPNHEKSYIAEARLLEDHGDAEGAVKSYATAIQINPSNRSTLGEIGNAYYSLGKYADAEKSYQKSLALLSPDESDPLTSCSLSTVLYAEGKNTKALEYAKKAYDSKNSLSQKNKIKIVYNYALLNDKTGNVDKAIELYSAVLKLNPNHVKTLINLGKMYLTIDPPDPSMDLKMLNKALAIEPNSFEINNNMGNAYRELKDYKNAIICYQKAIKIDANNAEAKKNLAKVYASDAQYDNASVLYLDILKANNKDWDSAIELAKVYIANNSMTDAEKYLIYVQSKAPDYRKDEVSSLLASIK